MSRSATKKRSTSGMRSSDLIEGTLRHVGKKQKLYLETHVCTIYRVTLTGSEPFSESRANTLMEKYRKKRQAHCNASLLEDQISFERTKSTGKIPFRSWVSYREITHLYISRSTPEMFTLCIDSQYSPHRYYEIYKCKSPDSTRKVEELIRCAMNNPGKAITDMDAIRQVSVLENPRIRSLPNFEMTQSHESLVENRVSSTVEEVLSPMPTQRYRTPSPQYIAPARNAPSPQYVTPVRSVPSPQYVAPVKQVNVNSSRTASTPPRFGNSLSDKDTTYIKLDPRIGAVEDEHGPIYMYLSRKNQDEYNSFNQNSKWNDDDRNTYYSREYNENRISYDRGY